MKTRISLRLSALLAASALLLAASTGCGTVAAEVVDTAGAIESSAEPAPAATGTPIATPTGDEDRLFIKSNEYFVFESDNSTYQTWLPALLITPASPATKMQGEFMFVRDSNKVWQDKYIQTRVLEPSEIRTGLEVIAFDGEKDPDEAYRPPASRDAARSGSWFTCTIGDTSDGFKGYVVCGAWKVQTTNFRIKR